MSWRRCANWAKQRPITLRLADRLGGHLVQGHVDTTGTCVQIVPKNGSTEYRFNYPPAFSSLIIEKGSICVNGISLPCFDTTQNEFTVAIIPYTTEDTNMKHVKLKASVNLEFDVIGKYIQRHLDLK